MNGTAIWTDPAIAPVTVAPAASVIADSAGLRAGARESTPVRGTELVVDRCPSASASCSLLGASGGYGEQHGGVLHRVEGVPGSGHDEQVAG